MPNLFERGLLEQETGLLKERWQQEGSRVINYSGDLDTNTTLYTVTPGMKLYVSYLIISTETAGNSTIRLTDGEGGTEIFRDLIYEQYEGRQYNLKVPLVFTTDVYAIVVSKDYNISFGGWEEPA